MSQEMQAYSQENQKPGLVTAIAIMTLINGIINIFVALGVTLTAIFASFGFGFLCVPITILPLVLGIFEIIYAAKLLPENPGVVKPSQTIAILEMCCILWGNFISLVVGILAMVFYNQPEIKRYFAGLNASVTSPPKTK